MTYKFYVFQDPDKKWQVWEEEAFRSAESNHTRNLQYKLGKEYSLNMLHCMHNATIVYEENTEKAIEKREMLK